LRSLEEYAPWVRKIFIVSNCKPPAWLDMNNVKINWVYHEDIFEDHELPTFSSHAIESKLHKIPGLSNFFVYANDDVILARLTKKSDFFYSNGLCKVKLESYGSVNANIDESEPDYLNAARNGQKLIFSKFGKIPTQLHTHSPNALRKDILEEMEVDFKIDFDRTSSNKFRHVSDISVTSFLFSHYVYFKGYGVYDPTPSRLIKDTQKFVAIYENLRNRKCSQRFISFCINDGAESEQNELWNRESLVFLNDYFPNKSQFEI
ncbi:stealth conserved region 3 domain-containing protein, partial [Photobacterium makurazakiensis]|uniref:stealth conserved region 3 domain-containing protein n=1 Tax=Photobacterium makurazakiensis TaxID=2910234 RepID=UPI003D120FE3